MDAVFLVLLILCLVGVAVRTVYELLKRDGKIDPQNKLVFGVVFAAMCVFLLSWPFMSPRDPLPLPLSPALRWVGLVALVAGAGLAFGGLIQLRGLENIEALVTSGVFAKLRHPMYTGFVLWVLGWGIFQGAGVSLVIGLACAGDVLFWRRLEEEKLAAEWGEEYRKYREKSWF